MSLKYISALILAFGFQSAFADQPFQISVTNQVQANAYSSVNPSLRKFFEGPNLSQAFLDSNCITPAFDQNGHYSAEWSETVGGSYDHVWVTTHVEIVRETASYYSVQVSVSNNGKIVTANIFDLGSFPKTVPGTTFESSLAGETLYDKASVTPMIVVGTCHH